MSARAWTARLGVALVTVCVLQARSARAEEVYRWIDDRGVVHLTNAPADPHFQKFETGGSGGTGRGILILIRREQLRARSTPYYDRSLASPAAYDGLIERAARRHGLPPALVKAVVKAESNFQPHALSDKGAQGLMQLMPETAEELGVENPFRAEDNVYAGTRYLRAMYDRFGDWQNALAAYNAGPSAVDRFGGVPPFAETQEYVQRVLHYYRRYDGDFSR